MCYVTDKITPLASSLRRNLSIYSKTQANRMIDEHIQMAHGQRSDVVILAEKFYAERKKLGLVAELNAVNGTSNQLSALREAIIMLLCEQAGRRLVSA